MKRKLIVAAALSLCVTAASASDGFAVSGKTVDNGTDTLKTYELQDVQVVSTRASKKTPVAFSNMTKEELKQLNFGKDIPALLSMMPSVTMSSDAGAGVGYTGIHVRGTDPTRINITANGIPMNDAESSQLYWVNLGDFASSVQSIQMQRGVGTSTNGAGAFGATINMQTENVGNTPYASLDLSAGSYGTHKETFRFSSGLLGKHWGFQGRLSNIGSDGYIDRASSRLNSYFLQGGYFSDKTVVKLITFNGKEKTYMAWDYASREQLETLGRTYNPSGMYTDDKGNTAYYKNQTDNYHQQHYQLLWNQYVSKDWTLNAALHYTRGDGYYEQYKESQKLYKYLLMSELDSKSDLIRQKRMENDFYGFVASMNYDNRRGLSANIGGGWNKYDGDHYGRVIWIRQFSGALNPDHKYYDNNAKKTDGNIYAKVNYEFVPGLNAFADLQYRHVNYKMTGSSQEFDDNKQQRMFDLNESFDFFNPKFGLTYNFLKEHTVYASYAIAHKEPTRNDYEDMMAEAEEVSPKAERLNDLEIGYKYESKIFSAGLNFYYMDYDNQFVLTGAQDSNGEMVARNIKDSYRMGIELQTALRPFDGFEWDMNATWSINRAKNMSLTIIDTETWEMSKENVGTTHLAFSPDFILANRISYEWKGLRASLMTKYISEQYMTNSNFKSFIDEDNGGKEVSAMIDDYLTTDLDLSYTFKMRGVKSITIGATIYNLFSKKYESNGACGLNFKRDNNGNIQAFNNHKLGFWTYSVYSAQAPIHFMAHLSLNF